MKDRGVGQFFDALTDDYTQTIERCFPRYREMLWALLDYLPRDRRFETVLELGCGTGNLSVLLHDIFPKAELRLVDLSAESLDVCRSRLATCGSLCCEQRDFADLRYPSGSFDLVISSISIHHLDAPGKQTLFRRIEDWLTHDGILCFADQCAGVTEDLYARHVENWKSLAMASGSGDSEWQMWMQHQADHDYHDTLTEQLDWLREAGFALVDCPWRYLLWSVVQARK